MKSWVGLKMEVAEDMQNAFLRDVLFPSINYYGLCDTVNNYNFIRYFEHYPQIRLRMEVDETSIDNDAIIYLLSEQDSRFKFKNIQSGKSIEKQGIDWKFYQIETDPNLFGNIKGLELAREHHTSSTKTILNYIREDNIDTIPRNLWQAILVEIIQGLSFKLSRDQLLSHFRKLFDLSFHIAFAYKLSNNPELEAGLRNNCEQIVHLQILKMKPYLDTILNGDSVIEFVKTKIWVEEWFEFNKKFFISVNNMILNKSVFVPNPLEKVYNIQFEQSHEMSIASFYLTVSHHSFNRLGLTPVQESLVYLSIVRTIESFN